jgi:hypothetical protein
MVGKRPSPFRIRWRKSPRKRKRLTVVVNDANRRPFPGIDNGPHRARHFITAMGRVYRDDGRLLAVTSTLKVQFSNRTTRSIPLAVVRAFGHQPPTRGHMWYPWVDPDGPIDKLTGRLRCSIVDIKLVPHSEIVAWAVSGKDPAKKPKTVYPLL